MRSKLWVLLFSLLGVSCVQKMGTEGHLRPLAERPAFSKVERKPPVGTVPQISPSTDLEKSSSQPLAYSRENLEKGQTQYRVYCMPCHGMSGYGDGMVVQRGFLAPPSFHQDRLREVPDSQIYDVITHGYGAMYSYSDRVLPSDRWAVVQYIRALQLSQSMDLKKLKPDEQKKIEALPRKKFQGTSVSESSYD